MSIATTLLILGGLPRPPAASAVCVGDCNGSGEVTVDELIRGVNIALDNAALSTCASFETNGDGTVTIDELLKAVNNALNGCPPESTPTRPGPLATVTPTRTLPAVTALFDTSPANGESDVAITRETILRFNGTLDPSSVTADAARVEFAGKPLAARLHLSPDHTRVTLFYNPPLPGTARIRVTVDGDRLRDRAGRRVDADGDGVAGGLRLIEFDTVNLVSFPGSNICGRVFASNPAPTQTGTFVNEPLKDVKIWVDGMEETLFAFTDQNGDFRLENVPAGSFFVHIEGLTATNPHPRGSYYPAVAKKWESVPGKEINIGEIYLPLVPPNTLQPVSSTDDTTVMMPPEVVAQLPQFEGVRITVPAGSLYSEVDGSRGGMIGLSPVQPNRLPGPLPPGVNISDVITVQAAGATDFDVPAPICFPNLDHLPPNSKSALVSFNHDTGRWENAGPTTVTADGKLVCSDPGFGIRAPGWHAINPLTDLEDGHPDPGDDPDQPPHPCDPPPACPTGECPTPPPAKNQGPGHPVYPFSGEFYEEAEDLRIKGRGVDFVWTRKYRAKAGPNTAQGNGWDFSYNIFLEKKGADVMFCDGTGRRDLFQRRPVGVAVRAAANEAGGGAAVAVAARYGRREFFQDLRCNCGGPNCAALCGGGASSANPAQPDPNLQMMFPDGGLWEYHPFDGRPEAGKIRRSVDRHGNALRFEYDALGRLVRVIDTLDRPITIAYEPEGHLASVTDFIGRQVRYTYYGNGEAGGGRGDLKTVTTMAVTGTPNGNDFPNGKTWTYTYTTGAADERLNHNLLTITDPKGQTYLANFYSTDTDPAAVNFDRVLRQIWGNPTDTIDFVYSPQTPTAANNQAVMKAIVRDRVGNVKEYLYDVRNRLVILREYTGRADPTKPTGETANRPKNKLRPSDPDVFETRYEYNNDSLTTRVTQPNGNILEYVYEGDRNRAATEQKRGDMRIVRRRPGAHTPPGDQATIEEQYEYDPRFGGSAFVTKHTDARGNVTLNQYNASGDKIRVQHRIASIVEDFEYNQFGQMTARVLPANGNGHRRRDEVTYYTTGAQLGYPKDQIVDKGGFNLTTTFEHDAVGNVTRVIDPRRHDTQYVVNQRDQVVRTISREVTDGSGTRYQVDKAYDANDNVVREDVQNVDENGAVQANSQLTTTTDYEILNYPLRVSSEIDATHTAVTQVDYDANRNRIRMRGGEATNGRQPANQVQALYDERDLIFRSIRAPGDAAQSTSQLDYDLNRNVVQISRGLESAPRLTTTVYDGYDRAVRFTDPMGNVRKRSCDPNGNVLSVTAEGEPEDVPGSAGNIRLSQATTTYDVMNRATRTEEAFFDTTMQQPIGDGSAVSTIEYADTSQVVRTVNDNGHAATTTYDSANRTDTSTDAAGNTTRYVYDANSNVVAVTEVEKSDLGSPQETFTSTTSYDNLDRLVQMIDSAGNTHRFAYDSRSNPVFHRDAGGNVVHTVFDGVDRPTEVIRDLTDTGDGTGTVIGTIRTRTAWDDNSRLIAQTDDLGNITAYAYDPLDRVIAMTMADASRVETAYDVHGNAVTMRDANGTAVRGTYDLLDRPVRTDITPNTGVASDTTFATSAYDGLSRVIRATDDDSSVARQYDSLSNVTAETLDGETTRSTHDGEGNSLTLTYPSGRVLTHTYDALERLKTIKDNNTLVAQYDYIGPSRTERRTLGNGTRTSFAYDTARRIVRTTHTAAQTPFDDRSYAWDPMYRKTRITDALKNSTITVQRDSIYRVKKTTKAGAQPRSVDYAYDGAQNRTQVTGVDTGPYTRDATVPNPADRQVNQYTATPFDARRYDQNGNLTQVNPSAGAQQTLSYDADDRMVSFASGSTNAHYRYDALGRRIENTVGGATTRFFFDGAQEIEEQDGAGNTLATYVYGNYVDEPLTMSRGGDTVFYHADQLYNVTALSDQSGAIAETYDYDDFGLPTFFDVSGAPRADSALGNPYLFTGRRFDPETGYYDYRSRYLDPRAGRFTGRDAIGAWGDGVNLGNAYAYVGNDPFSSTDPSGRRPPLSEFGVPPPPPSDTVTGIVDNPGDFFGGMVDTTMGFIDAYGRFLHKLTTGKDVVPDSFQTLASDGVSAKYGSCFAKCFAARTAEAATLGLVSLGDDYSLQFGWGSASDAAGGAARNPTTVTKAAERGLIALDDLRLWPAVVRAAKEIIDAQYLIGEKTLAISEIAVHYLGQAHKFGGPQALAELTQKGVIGGLEEAHGLPLQQVKDLYVRSVQNVKRFKQLTSRAEAAIARLGQLRRQLNKAVSKLRKAGKALTPLAAGLYANDLRKCLDCCARNPCDDCN